jgi:hypothetical protein
MKTIRVGDVQNSLIRLILWQAEREPITDRHLREARKIFKNKCAYCGEIKELHFDHAVPINKTSLGQHRVGNLVPSCAECNQRKGQKDFRQFLSQETDSESKIATILKYMDDHGYRPFAGDNVKECLERARSELSRLADKYIAEVASLLPRSSPSQSTIPLAEPVEVVSAPKMIVRTPAREADKPEPRYASPHSMALGQIKAIKKRMNRSWPNLRLGCRELMGEKVGHGTPNVGAASRVFARNAARETRLTYAGIIELLDRNGL